MKLTKSQEFQKRAFDFTLSLFGLILSLPIIAVAWIVATVESRSNGFFVQERVGRGGKMIKVIKIRTMKPNSQELGTITTKNDSRVTKSGAFFRRTKIDELPQLFNVLIGDMSLVGPRPDVAGYADKLEGEDREILTLRPAITGPATLKYRDEEEILASVENPKEYNDRVIWPDKVRINRKYLREWSLKKDIKYIWETVVG